jgi:malonyl-CoA O-methyltransferase
MISYPLRVRQDFSHAAATYDVHASLQRQVTGDLAQIAQPFMSPGTHWLDVGCGTGALTHWLSAQARSVPTLVQLDLAEGMCRLAAPFAPTLCADALHLPFAPATFDGAFSSLTLQWATPIEAALGELRRVLRPGSVLAFSTLLPGTLAELEEAFTHAGLPSPLHLFYPAHIWEAALLTHGFRLETRQTHAVPLPFATPRAVLAHLKGLGATRKRDTQPLTPGQLTGALRAYPRTAEGGVTATYHLWLGLARAV